MKPVAAGRLRSPVFLGKPVIVKDAAGGESLTWAELATWADIQPASGREWVTGAAIKDQVDARIVIRLTDGWMPSARWRIRDAVTDALYNIVSVLAQPHLGAAECLAKTAQGSSDGR